MALYHQHRPKTFSEILGQTHITQTIQNQLKSDRVGHAYLFSGPRGIGKTSTARILAKAVNCTDSKDGLACNACENCIHIDSGSSIDIMEIDAATHTGVDNVRKNIIENAQFRPTQLKMKVFIIDEVHMLSGGSFNALLKILEEPPAYIMFILATTEMHKIPDTIISRCQRFQFDKIEPSILCTHVKKIAKQENITIDDDAIARIVALSQGCARDAVSLFEQVAIASDGEITTDQLNQVLPTASLEIIINYLDGIITHNAEIAFSAVKDIVSSNNNPFVFVNRCIEVMRDILLIKLNQISDEQTYVYTATQIKKLKELATRCEPTHLVRLIDLLSKRRRMIKSAPIQTLPLEMIIMECCPPSQHNKSDKEIPEDKQPPKQPTQKKEPSKEKKLLTEDAVADKPTKSVTRNAPNKTDDVEQAWNTCIQVVKEEKPSLVFMLKTATIDEVSDQIVSLIVPNQFQFDKISQDNTKKYLEETLSKAYIQPVTLDISVKNDDNAQSNASDLADLADLVGGEVVV